MNDILRDLSFKEVDAGVEYRYAPTVPLPAMGLNIDGLTPDQRLFADAGVEVPNGQRFPLSDVERDILRRKVAARRDASMLGDSGYDRIEADFYPTPPENVDCLLEHFIPHGGTNLIWEPACGKGDISQRLMEFGFETWSSDLHDQGFGTPGMDFLAQSKLPNPNIRSIVTNPPYADGLAEKFARHAIKLMQPVRGQVAMFLRNEFDCGKGRMDLFGLPPFHKKIVVTKRPRWIEGSTGSPRHNYAWFVWDWRHKAGNAGIAYSHPDYAPAPDIDAALARVGATLDRITKH